MTNCKNKHCAETNETVQKQIVCDTLEAFAQLCAIKGKLVSYRRADNCRKYMYQCISKYVYVYICAYMCMSANA